MRHIKGLGLLIGLLLFVSDVRAADTVLTCVEEKTTHIVWKSAGMLTPAGLKAEAKDPTNPTLLTFIITKTGAVLKGNQGSADLIKIAQDTYAESNDTGNIILWTVLPAKNGVPTYLITHKIYRLVGPAAFTIAFKCQ